MSEQDETFYVLDGELTVLSTAGLERAAVAERNASTAWSGTDLFRAKLTFT
jgi:hypothetical protein